MKLRSGVALATVVASLAFAASASAASIVVNTSADENGTGPNCSLREALVAASTNAPYGGCSSGGTVDTITFVGLGPNPQINLSFGELLVDSPVNIVGPGDLTVNGPSSGGRVFNINGGGQPVTISGMEITGANITAGGDFQGGGILNSTNLTLTNVRVTNNVMTGTSTGDINMDGAGIFSSSGTLTLDHSVVAGNQALAVTSGTANNATARGGGIGSNGPVFLHYSSVAENQAVAQNTGTALTGGGAEASGGGVRAAGTFYADHSSITGNVADARVTGSGTGTASLAQGAGLLTLSGLSLELTTVAGNRLIAADANTNTQQGGGLELAATPATIVSSTIADNGPGALSTSQLTSSANVHSTGVGSRTFSNTIIANPAGDSTNTNCHGDVPYTSNGTNVDHSVAGASCFGVTTDLTGDPLLGALQNNGGPTETMLPAANSSVIDAGTASAQSVDPNHDQRGFTRPVDFSGVANQTVGGIDGSDIGAVEVQKACATQATPAALCPGPPPGPTGQLASALKKCKKKHSHKARKRCRKKANQLPA